MKSFLGVLSFLTLISTAHANNPGFTLDCATPDRDGAKIQLKVSPYPTGGARSPITLTIGDGKVYKTALLNASYEDFTSKETPISLSNAALNVDPELVSHVLKDAAMPTIHRYRSSAVLAERGNVYYLYCDGE